MYIFPDMIDMALAENDSFPSDAHRKVAQAIAICNPNVHTIDTMIAVVKAVNAVPQDRIETIFYQELVDVFGMPDVGMYY